MAMAGKRLQVDIFKHHGQLVHRRPQLVLLQVSLELQVKQRFKQDVSRLLGENSLNSKLITDCRERPALGSE
jgi:hypothetical protein